jgi:hypothetical protein
MGHPDEPQKLSIWSLISMIGINVGVNQTGQTPWTCENHCICIAQRFSEIFFNMQLSQLFLVPEK